MGQGALTPSPRRAWLLRAGARLAGLCAAPALLSGCERPGVMFSPGRLEGGFVGAAFERGHRLRQAQSLHAAASRRAEVLIVGGGIAGLAAARALRQAGIDDFALFELEDQPGGNSRGALMPGSGGLAHPLGAHYLPAPGEAAHEVRAWLREIGLARAAAGGTEQYDEASLCHSPQERLLVAGQWQEGLLPASAEPSVLAEYRRFATVVAQWTATSAFTIPSPPAPLKGELARWEQMSFAAWLDAQGLRQPQLRWYLDYCCRDDYGAGPEEVSAWAGIHYFASRHGFALPGGEGAPHGEAGGESQILTWPQGNGWLSARLARHAQSQLQPGCLVYAAAPQDGGWQIEVLRFDGEGARRETWRGTQLLLACPLFVAARLLGSAAPPALTALMPRLRYAAWMVANVYVPEPLEELPGQPRSWDNVVYGSKALGYVDARHQDTAPLPPSARPTVLTWYAAYGGSAEAKRALLDKTWAACAAEALDDLRKAHADIGRRARRVDVMRYGHAMLIPSPGLRSDPALAALGRPPAERGALARLHFAHADLSGYSVFEEAFTWGTRVGQRIAAQLGARRA
jgi:predicted NAD/FAD-dependent oxidoreductase